MPSLVVAVILTGTFGIALSCIEEAGISPHDTGGSDTGSSVDTGDYWDTIEHTEVSHGYDDLVNGGQDCVGLNTQECCELLHAVIVTDQESLQALFNDKLYGSDVPTVDFNAGTVLVSYTEYCAYQPTKLLVEEVSIDGTELVVNEVLTMPDPAHEDDSRPYNVVTFDETEFSSVTASVRLSYTDISDWED